MGENIAGCQSQLLGALACQKDSYLRTLETEVVSCVKFSPPKVKSNNPKKKNAAANVPVSEAWLVEFSDSVLFPEGGGQPCDHGSLVPLADAASEPIPITRVERQGLKSVCHVDRPLEPGILVRQDIDFGRRWDHMQQHTGQHLLSAVMEKYHNIKTLGWGMGTDGGMNYVDIPRNPAPEEIQEIQDKCNEIIRSNLNVTVQSPGGDVASSQVDQEKGLVRVISIGDLDHNACCGTHLSQTSHISLILLHHTQPVHSTNCRLFFSVGDRAIKSCTESINALRLISKSISSPNNPADVIKNVKNISDTATDMKRQEKKLLAEIAGYESSRVKASLEEGKHAWVYRASGNLEYLNMVVHEVKDSVKGQRVVVLVAGEGQSGGPIVIIGQKDSVSEIAKRVQRLLPSVKGGGKGEKWQGKVPEWRKGDLDSLKGLAYITLAHSKNNLYADSATAPAPAHGGLSAQGEDMVREMNRIGIIIGLSHTSEAVMQQVLDVSAAPVIFSHSSVASVVPHTRNVPDAILEKLRLNKGVIMISFIPTLTTAGGHEANLDRLVDHILHVADLIGYDHIGLGSDFDGMFSAVPGIDDVSHYPSLVIKMLERSIATADVQKILGLNVIRVMEEVEAVSASCYDEIPVLEEEVKQLWNAQFRAAVRQAYPHGEKDTDRNRTST